MIKLIERLTDRAGILAAWMLFAIGLMVTYEVVMRKMFNAPTVWADELARFFQIWAVYLAGAYVLKNRHLIAVELLAGAIQKQYGRILDFLSLVIIALFCGVAIWYGSSIVYESIEQGRHTSTMLGVPKWMTESAIPVTFLLLLLQTLVEMIRLSKAGPSGTLSPASELEQLEK